MSDEMEHAIGMGVTGLVGVGILKGVKDVMTDKPRSETHRNAKYEIVPFKGGHPQNGEIMEAETWKELNDKLKSLRSTGRHSYTLVRVIPESETPFLMEYTKKGGWEIINKIPRR